MKQLTKEQHEAILQYLSRVYVDGAEGRDINKTYKDFEDSFPPSCADGEHCKSEPITISQEDYQTPVKKVNGIIKDSRI